ncbi:MAG: signal recognition particle protein [Microscillaceae bacterium]|nr:signal recognition particle protein [Microscillaceae bacterium]MDW8460763.1 signal recognition particle protein [Cytophagales bacterium]
MFESLTARLDEALKTLKGTGRITDVNVASTVKEIRKALVDADVNYKIAKTITDNIKEKAIGRKITIAVKPSEMLVKIVHEELTELMGGQAQDINLKGEPAVILIAGLQGSGKTTFSAKLANYIKRQGRSVLLVACDVYRPAAIQQLQSIGEKVGVEVYAELDNKNPVQIAQNSIEYAKKHHYRVVIVDTAGRLAIDEEMMQEIENIKKAINPSETLFVVDAMTGQDAVNTAKTFHDRLNFDGVVLTKLDGDTRGGAALSIRTVVNKPIKFVGMGEKVDALNSIDRFYPDRMANRILGMGDIVSLVEKAQKIAEEEESKRIAAQIRKNQFNLEDFYSQIQQIKRMGNLKDMISMIPGIGKMIKDIEIDDNAFVPIEALIQSMTPKERQNPELLANPSRKKRIVQGSGRSMAELNSLISQFSEIRKIMKKMNATQMPSISKASHIKNNKSNKNKNKKGKKR